MFVRIVKMSFAEENIIPFLDNFETVKQKIRNFEGCQFLELYRDKHNTNIFFTNIYWNTEDDLNNYRDSDLFQSVWTKTKQMFNAKPELGV